MKRFSWVPLVVAVAIGLFVGLTAPAGRATSQATARQASGEPDGPGFQGQRRRL